MAESLKVKNFRGPSGIALPPEYVSWLEFWEAETGHEAGKCAHHCGRDARIGAHVQCIDEGLEYIVPLCLVCAARGDVFSVRKVLVRPVV